MARNLVYTIGTNPRHRYKVLETPADAPGKLSKANHEHELAIIGLELARILLRAEFLKTRMNELDVILATFNLVEAENTQE